MLCPHLVVGRVVPAYRCVMPSIGVGYSPPTAVAVSIKTCAGETELPNCPLHIRLLQNVLRGPSLSVGGERKGSDLGNGLWIERAELLCRFAHGPAGIERKELPYEL